MANFSFSNTPEGGLSVSENQQQYLESTDQIAGLELEGDVSDGDVIEFDGATNSWKFTSLSGSRNVITIEDNGTETVSDLSTLNFDTYLSVTGGGSGTADVSLTSEVLLEDRINFSIQSVASNSNTNGNVLNIVNANSGSVTITIDTVDATDGSIVVVSEIDGTNNVSVTTEGSASVNGGADDSVTAGGSKIYAYDNSRSDWTVIATT